MSDVPDDVLARYHEAREIYVNDYAELRHTKHVWQRTALVAGLVAVIAVVGLVVVSTQQKVVPVVVELDGNKTVVRTYPAEPLLPPSAQHTRATLGRWIQHWRGVSADLFVIEERMAFVFAVIQSGSAAEQRISGWLRDNNPYERAQNETVEVDVIAVTKVAGESWQIDWRETTYSRGGSERNQKRFSATTLVSHGQPQTESVLLNPGGLFISSIDWQEAWVDL